MATELPEPSLVDKVVSLHQHLVRAGIGHAFGGALALAYWTAEPRATADVDLNISLPATGAEAALACLPDGVVVPLGTVEVIREAEQVRLWWGRTPVDLFFRAHAFHDGVAERAVQRPFAGESLPFVCADDLAVLKALFNRPKDWLDIAAMFEHGAIEIPTVVARVHDILGGDDERTERLHALSNQG